MVQGIPCLKAHSPVAPGLVEAVAAAAAVEPKPQGQHAGIICSPPSPQLPAMVGKPIAAATAPQQ